jgi:hypothetical protein
MTIRAISMKGEVLEFDPLTIQCGYDWRYKFSICYENKTTTQIFAVYDWSGKKRRAILLLYPGRNVISNDNTFNILKSIYDKQRFGKKSN